MHKYTTEEQFEYILAALRSLDKKMDILIEQQIAEDPDKFEEEYDL